MNPPVDSPESRATFSKTSTFSFSIAASSLYPALDTKKIYVNLAELLKKKREESKNNIYIYI